MTTTPAPAATEPLWSEGTRDVLYDIYRLWAQNGRAPNLRDLYERQGLERSRLRQVLLELQQGFAVAVADDRLQLNILKAPPFSAVPTPVLCEIDGAFHTYLGCAAEATTIGHLPMYQERMLTIRSYCGCCYAPIELEAQGPDLRGVGPAPYAVITQSPWDWGPGVPCDRVCDAFHFVLDPAHAERFDRQSGRRSVVLTLGQLQALSHGTATRRMHDPVWGPIRRRPADFIAAIASTGADVTPWTNR